MATSEAGICQLCNFSYPSMKLWLKHLRSVHEEDTAFSVTCNIEDCTASYTKCLSFVSHLYRQHRDTVTTAPERQADMAGNNSNNVTDNRERDIGSILGMPTLDDNQELVRSDVQHAVDQLLQTDGDDKSRRRSKPIKIDCLVTT